MKTLTPVTRARLAAAAAVPLLLLTSCGGDSNDDTSNDAAGGDVPALEGEDCDADVTLSGALTAEWSGGATVAVSESDVAPPATYQANDGDYMLTASAVGNGFDDPTVILLADGRSFGVAFGDGSVEVADDGSGATIDAPANDVAGSGDTVQVKATITC